MDLFTSNYGFLHISEQIFNVLDHKSLLSCRSVNQSWKTVLDNPRFWIKKLTRKMSELKKFEAQSWNELLEKIRIQKNTSLEENMVKVSSHFSKAFSSVLGRC